MVVVVELDCEASYDTLRETLWLSFDERETFPPLPKNPRLSSILAEISLPIVLDENIP